MANNALEKSELWEVSRKLIGFNTVSSSSNVEAAEYLANVLEEIGFTVQILRETVQGVEKAMVLAWAGPEVPGGLILSGHIDIVPFEGQPGWTMDPLTMRVEGEKIFGRGVTDMKVFLVQAMLAAKKYPLQKLKKPLLYIFTCDEELAGQGAERLVKILPDVFHAFPLPSHALIGEPTNFEVFPAHKGYAAFDVVVHGKGGHSSSPNYGLNAIERMADVIALLRETNERLRDDVTEENRRLFPDFPASVINSAVINGGLAANMIPDTCRLTVSIRVTPGDPVDDILQEVWNRIEDEIAAPMKERFPEGGVTIEHVIKTGPLQSPIDDPFCELLGQVMGRPAQRGAPYATDGGQFQQLGIHSYICGPGLLEEAHQPNESIPVANFLLGLEKVEEIIYRWCVQ